MFAKIDKRQTNKPGFFFFTKCLFQITIYLAIMICTNYNYRKTFLIEQIKQIFDIKKNWWFFPCALFFGPFISPPVTFLMLQSPMLTTTVRELSIWKMIGMGNFCIAQIFFPFLFIWMNIFSSFHEYCLERLALHEFLFLFCFSFIYFHKQSVLM